MKWIGQHIWDFISRFRSDVYLEDLDNSIEKCTLVVDNDGKVYKNCDRRNVTGNTVDGVITYKDDDEIKVEPGLTFKDITNYVQLEAGIDDGKGFKIKRKDTPSSGDGGHIVIEGGQASGVDNDGGAIFLTPGKSTGDASGAYVSMMGNSPAAPNSNNSTVQSNWNAAWQQATYKVEDAAWQLVNSFIQFSPNFLLSSGGIDSWGTQANHRMTIRTYAWPGNPTNFPGGPIIVEPNNNRINNTTSGDFRINTSGTNIMLTNGGYHSATNDRSEIYINSNAELTLKTFKQFGGDAHIILEPEGNIKLTPSVSVEVDGEIYLQEDHKIIFEGATSNNYETTLYVVDPTADRDINLPNASGTIALTSQLDHDTLTNYVANEHIDWTGASAGTIHATNYSNDDVSVANLKTRLGSGFQGNAVSIGDSDDTVTIPGNLTVSGTTTTINTTDLNVEDKNITLNYHATNDTSGSADGAGITIQDAVNATTDASISWNAGSDYWNFSHKASLADGTAIRGNLFWLNTDNQNRMTTIRGNANGGNKTIDLPNATGTLALTSDIPKSIMAARTETSTVFNLFKGSLWFGANASTLDWGVNTPPVLTNNLADNINYSYQRGALVTAISNMTIYKVYFNMRWSSKVNNFNGTKDFKFAFFKATHANNSAAKHALSAVTTNSLDGAYTNSRNYNLVFDFSSGSGYTLSAGDSLHMFTKNTSYNSSTSIYSQMGGQIYIEYKYV
jgi:hypothetical protein